MANQMRQSFRALLGASGLALLLGGAPVMADSIFTPSSDGFVGRVSASAAARGQAVVKGAKAVISGEGLVPGQQLTVLRGATSLGGDAPLVVDSEGKFSLEITIDEAAATGLQPIVVIGEKPAAATVVDLKISPLLALSGAEQFDIKSAKIAPGLYQVAWSPASKAFFVTSSVGRPPVTQSQLSKVDPETLEVIASITPAPLPARADAPAPKAGEAEAPAPVHAVYGIDVDEANGTVWVSNTRQDTVSVYSQSDLTLIKQFEPGAVPHAHTLQVDEGNGRVYVSSARHDSVHVFDTATLSQLEPIRLKASQRGAEFMAQGIHLDDKTGQLFTVSLAAPELAVTDVKTGKTRMIALKGAVGAASVDYDPVEDLIFVAAQGSDNLLIIKGSDGTVLHDVETGAGALDVVFDPANRQAFVGNRTAGTIAVVSTTGKITANLELGSYPNQLIADGEGNVLAVNKSRGEDDDSGDRLWEITPRHN